MRSNDTFLIYRKGLCRVLPVVFSRSGVTNDGFPAYWFRVSDNAFDSPDRNPENACYCRPDVGPCLMSGLADIRSCYYSKLTSISVMTNYVSFRKVLCLLLSQCTCCPIWRTRFSANRVSWLLQRNDARFIQDSKRLLTKYPDCHRKDVTVCSYRKMAVCSAVRRNFIRVCKDSFSSLRIVTIP